MENGTGTGTLIPLGGNFTAIRLMHEARKKRDAPPERPRGKGTPTPERPPTSPALLIFNPEDEQLYHPGTKAYAETFCQCCWHRHQEEDGLCSRCRQQIEGMPRCIHGGEPTSHPHEAWDCPMRALSREAAKENNT